MSNYWDDLMDTDEGAASYMEAYGEGPGSETRYTIASFIEEDDTVLDIGCGPGWNFDHFKKFSPKVKKYKGIDYSERFVKVANDRNPGIYELGDCRDLKEPDNSWDIVILQDILEHTNGYEKPVREALRVAKKKVIITFWRRLQPKDQHDINDDGNDGYGASYSRPLWEQFLKELGYDWQYKETSQNRYHEYYVLTKS